MMVWIGEMGERKQPLGPFDGVLVIMNVGSDAEPNSDGMKAIWRAYEKALSKGWLIMHVFDRGIEPPPWFLGQVDGHNLPCISSRIGKEDFDFSFSPDERKAEFERISKVIFSDDEVKFARHPGFEIAGNCRIAGEDVVLPPIEL